MADTKDALLTEVMDFCGASEEDPVIAPLISAAKSYLTGAIGSIDSNEHRTRYLIKILVKEAYDVRELESGGGKKSNSVAKLVDNFIFQLRTEKGNIQNGV